LIYRTEDLDQARCREAYTQEAQADLHWLGITWQEGPDVGGPHAPYQQSARLAFYSTIWQKLHARGLIYPCDKSRQDVARSLQAPHAEDDREPIFPPEWRPSAQAHLGATDPGKSNWRFRVPDGEVIRFVDEIQGPQTFTAGKDFGDFIVWRKDGFPSYELAVVSDDHAMGITEVVRGADLLLSTARQKLLYRALGWTEPAWAHASLILDQHGQRLAKRTEGLSLQSLRERGKTSAEVLTAPVSTLWS
jgi:glutamyl-tRNA synthetase